MTLILGWFKCKLGFHAYKIERFVSGNAAKVRCDRCNGKWAFNHSMQALIPWSADVAHFYDVEHPINQITYNTHGDIDIDVSLDLPSANSP